MYINVEHAFQKGFITNFHALLALINLLPKHVFYYRLMYFKMNNVHLGDLILRVLDVTISLGVYLVLWLF